MRVVWTQEAVDDLESIVTYIKRDSPEAAHRVAKEIFDRLMTLPSSPFRGRNREEDKDKEVVFAPWPYIAVYGVEDQIIYIKAIRHTSRDWDH